MKNLDFKYISAQNFLCFGPQGIEFNFEDFSNIVLIRGNNLDIKEIDDKVASNGVGKSSIPEIIVYALFGKTIKHPKKITHKDVINNQIGKNLKTEVRWGDLRVIRTRKPDSLRIWEDPKHEWKDETEITLGGIPATQKLIEEKIGLNYETFVNVLIFTDNNAGSFLECDANDKRQIVENLLSLDKYRNFADKAKEIKKDKKDSIKSVSYEHETLSAQIKQIESRLETTKNQEKEWNVQKKKEIKDFENKIKELKESLSSTDEGQEISLYLESQKEIDSINKNLSELEEKQSELEEIISLAKDKINLTNRNFNSLTIKIDNVDASIEKIKSNIKDCVKEINKFEENKGSKCKFCLGEVSEDNYKKYVSEIRKKILELESEILTKNSEKERVVSESSDVELVLNKINKGLQSAKLSLDNNNTLLTKKRKRLQDLNKIEKPQNKNVSNQIIEEKINNLEDQIINKNKELNESPFIKIINSISEDLIENRNILFNKKKELEELEKDLPYYDFWVTAFGDTGIRKFVIDGVIPALNSRIAYWLQFLIDGKTKLEFNNELEEKIERNPSDGDPFVYHAMSGGERRRLNLAVSQAFAYVMSLSSGVCPSIVFLDEVTTNIDPIGVYGVYNMITELSKDRKVFITTHDQNLLDLLEGCELIRLEKKGGFTKIKKI
jgi:DNA repair exonuclease SbcCD ATPase subunit